MDNLDDLIATIQQASRGEEVRDAITGALTTLGTRIGTSVADAIQEALDSGEFVGRDGPPGEPGPQGIPGEPGNSVGTIWKEAVASFEDISTTYPEPEEDWTVCCLDTGFVWQYDGAEWVHITDNTFALAAVDVALNYDSRNPVRNAAVTSLLGAILNQLIDFSNALDYLNGEDMDLLTRQFSVVFTDGDGHAIQTQTVSIGQDAVYTGSTPTKTGEGEEQWVFDGWEPEPKAVFQDMVCQAVFFDANQPEFTVIFMDGDEVLKTVENVRYGGYVNPPAVPVRVGYSFKNWEDEAGISRGVNGIANIIQNLVLHPVYDERAEQFTVVFQTDQAVLATVYVPYNGSAEYTGEEPVRERYVFIGWSPEPVLITQNTTCLAVFEHAPCTVQFMDGETLVDTVSVPYNTAVAADQIPDGPGKDGYLFDGWFSEDDRPAETVPVTEDVIFHAGYTQAYTVTFMNGQETVKTVAVRQNATVPTDEIPEEILKIGYQQEGWYTAGNGSVEEQIIIDDTVFAARFVAMPAHTVTFMYDNTVLQTVTNVPYNGTAAYTEEAPENANLVFTGWYPHPVNVTEDLICYAQFEDWNANYQVTLVKDGSIYRKITMPSGSCLDYNYDLNEDQTKLITTAMVPVPNPDFITSDIVCELISTPVHRVLYISGRRTIHLLEDAAFIETTYTDKRDIQRTAVTVEGLMYEQIEDTPSSVYAVVSVDGTEQNPVSLANVRSETRREDGLISDWFYHIPVTIDGNEEELVIRDEKPYVLGTSAFIGHQISVDLRDILYGCEYVLHGERSFGYRKTTPCDNNFTRWSGYPAAVINDAVCEAEYEIISVDYVVNTFDDVYNMPELDDGLITSSGKKVLCRDTNIVHYRYNITWTDWRETNWRSYDVVPTYSSLGAYTGVTLAVGLLALCRDTGQMYQWDGAQWNEYDDRRPFITLMNGEETILARTKVNLGSSPCHAFTWPEPVSGDARQFNYFEPRTFNITADLVSYAQFCTVSVEEITDGWETIAANHGRPYPIGAYKRLRLYHTKTKTDFGYVRMQKVRGQTENADSLWVAMDCLSSPVGISSVSRYYEGGYANFGMIGLTFDNHFAGDYQTFEEIHPTEGGVYYVISLDVNRAYHNHSWIGGVLFGSRKYDAGGSKTDDGQLLTNFVDETIYQSIPKVVRNGIVQIKRERGYGGISYYSHKWYKREGPITDVKRVWIPSMQDIQGTAKYPFASTLFDTAEKRIRTLNNNPCAWWLLSTDAAPDGLSISANENASGFPPIDYVDANGAITYTRDQGSTQKGIIIGFALGSMDYGWLTDREYIESAEQEGGEEP